MDVLIMNLETVGSQGDIKKLRRLFNVVETQVRELKGLGVAESYGALLSSTLLNKLPQEIPALSICVFSKLTETSTQYELFWPHEASSCKLSHN